MTIQDLNIALCKALGVPLNASYAKLELTPGECPKLTIEQDFWKHQHETPSNKFDLDEISSVRYTLRLEPYK